LRRCRGLERREVDGSLRAGFLEGGLDVLGLGDADEPLDDAVVVLDDQWGSERTWYSLATSCCSSTLTFSNSTSVHSSERSSRIGSWVLHGPHQSA